MKSIKWMLTVIAFSICPLANAAVWGTTFSLGQMNIDPDTANAEGIEDGGLVFSMDIYTVIAKHIHLGGGVFGLSIDDSQAYTQQVTDGSGGSSTAKSSLSVGAFFLETGLKFRPISVISTDFLVGYAHDFSNRQITKCIDCYSEKLDIPAGYYVRPRVSAIKAMHDDISYFGFGIEYMYFLDQKGFTDGVLGSFVLNINF